MATVELTAPMRPNAGQAVVVRAVTVIMGTVVGLTFLFGFGNVLNLALRLGVPGWVAPLVAPAVDLSILGLLYWTTWRFRCRSTVLSEPACGLSTQSSPGRPSSGDAGATWGAASVRLGRSLRLQRCRSRLLRGKARCRARTQKSLATLSLISPLDSVVRRPVWVGVYVCAHPLRVEQDEKFNNAAVGAAQPVRQGRVELGCLTGRQG